MQKYQEIREREFCPFNTNNNQLAYTCHDTHTTPTANASMELLRSPIRRAKYITSIENWSPGKDHIYCPKCDKSTKPLTKSRAARFTKNECSACCLVSCWPFWFIPWLISGKNVEYLYCANCKTFLGIYIPTKNCIKPNELYVPTAEDGQCTVKHKHSSGSINENLDQIKDNQTNRSDLNATNMNQLPIITVNGKELPPETVQRIHKYKAYASMLGIDLSAPSDKENHTLGDSKTKELAPSINKNGEKK